MSKSRRDFLKLLASSTLSLPLDLDIDKLLWVPGAKKIFLPSVVSPSISDIVAIELERCIPHLKNIFERDDMFYKLIGERPIERISTREMRILLEIKPSHKR